MPKTQSKVCYQCEKIKPLTDFNKKRSSKDGYQGACRACCNANSKAHYAKNKEREKARCKKNRGIARIAARAYVREILITNGCVDCGERDLVVLDFDHMGNKKCSIARMLSDGSKINRIADEIEKCEIRCANCHRRKTAKDFGWWRLE